jgi:tetraacyldisaccharide 4'-kinase
MYKVPAALAPILFVPGLAYEAFVRARNRLYSTARLQQHRLPAPVISVGNITLGGSGKTPLVIYVAQSLAKLGHTPVILTRGYGRSHPNKMQIIAPGETIPNPAALLGDEPALIRRHVPSAWLGVSGDRLEAGKIIAGRDPKIVFILDDGFQHRRLHRDLDIVIIDESQPLQSNRVFPRGSLREPVSALRRCHLVVINRSLNEEQPDSLEPALRNVKSEAKLFHCKQRIRALIPFHSWESRAPGSGVANEMPSQSKSVLLVSALGNPERFQRDIVRFGVGVPGAAFFPDHHRLNRRDWQNCAERARRKGADTIITTEKDAVKVDEPPDFPLLVALQATEMAEVGAFEAVLKNCIEGRQ